MMKLFIHHSFFSYFSRYGQVRRYEYITLIKMYWRFAMLSIPVCNVTTKIYHWQGSLSIINAKKGFLGPLVQYCSLSNAKITYIFVYSLIVLSSHKNVKLCGLLYGNTDTIELYSITVPQVHGYLVSNK